MSSHQKHLIAPKEFIALMAILMSVVAISIDALLPALGIIGEALKTTHANQAQYIISAIFAGEAIGLLIFGPLSDAIGRKKVLYGSLSLYLAGSVVCLLATNLETMLLGRVIQGFGVAGPYVSCMSIIRDKFSGRPMARVMSLVMMIFIMVPIVAPAIGQTIIAFSSWHAIFVLYIVYALAVMLWMGIRLEETLLPEHRIPFRLSTILRGAKAVLTNRKTVCYMICMGCMFGALIGNLNSAQQIFQQQFGVGKMFVVYFGLQAFTFGISSLINSKWVERLGMRYMCKYALGLMALASALFLVTHLVTDIQFWMFFVYGMVILFCVGLLFGNLNALALEPMGHIAGIASAIIGAMSNVIAIILGTIIGQLYDGTLIPMVTGFTALSLAALVILLSADRFHSTTY